MHMKPVSKRLNQIFFLIFLCVVAFDARAVVDKPSKPKINDVLVQNCPKAQNFSGVAGANLIFSGSGNIRFLQAFFYTDSDCSTLGGVASSIDNSSHALSISGQKCGVVSFSPHYLYALAESSGVTLDDVSCMGLYLTSSNESFDGMSCQNFTDMDCDSSTSTCTSNQTKNVAWTASPGICSQQIAYIPNATTSSSTYNITMCDVNTDSTLDSCGTYDLNDTLDTPKGVTTGSSQIYVTNNATGNNTLSHCELDASGAINSSSCRALSDTNSTLNSPSGITKNLDHLYVVNEGASTVSRCTESSNVLTCNETGSGFNDPVDIVINKGFAYVSDSGDEGSISVCTLSDATGNFHSCRKQPLFGFNSPRGMLIHKGNFYGVNNGTSSVTQCTVGADGGFSACPYVASDLGLSGAELGIDILNNYAYITNASGGSDDDGSILYCDYSQSTGIIANCNATGSGANIPYAISVSQDNGYAYVVNHGNNKVMYCPILSDGSLGTCANTGNTNFYSPYDIAVNAKDGYALITSNDSETTFKCTIESDGSLGSSCSNNGAFYSPIGVALYTINNSTYAYITNSDYDISVSKCTVSSSGDVSGCSEITNSDFVSPFGITAANGYVYVTNESHNGIIQCAINTDDGNLENCGSIDLLNNPRGVITNDNFLYIANKDGDLLTQCSLSSEDGGLNTCQLIGQGLGFSQPIGVTKNNGNLLVVNSGTSVSTCPILPGDGTISQCTQSGTDFNGAEYIAIY